MKKATIKTILFSLFGCLFTLGILTGMVGRAICIRDTQNYHTLQPELFAPDEIAAVWHDEELQQLYVCYNDASYVNVYTEDGEFLWAVSAPYMRNAYFELQDDRLIIYNDVAYIYDSRDGHFIKRTNSDELELNYELENEQIDTPVEGEYYFDTYQVYRGTADGNREIIVSRPFWYWCFNFGICWLVSLVGLSGLAILKLLPTAATRYAVLCAVEGMDKKLRFIFRYGHITIVVHFIYAFLNLAVSYYTNVLIIGIFPLAIHFIFSTPILERHAEFQHPTQEEQNALQFITTWKWASFILAFFSAGVVAVLSSI